MMKFSTDKVWFNRHFVFEKMLPQGKQIFNIEKKKYNLSLEFINS
jgi:hypothetical protein